MTERPIGPAYAGQPVILVHVMTGDRAACADTKVSNMGMRADWHPDVPRVMCPGCTLTVGRLTGGCDV